MPPRRTEVVVGKYGPADDREIISSYPNYTLVVTDSDTGDKLVEVKFPTSNAANAAMNLSVDDLKKLHTHV